MTACSARPARGCAGGHQDGGADEPSDGAGQHRVERHRRVHEGGHHQAHHQRPCRPARPTTEPGRGRGEHRGDRPDAGGRREPVGRQRTEIDAELDERRSLIGVDPGLEQRHERGGHAPARATVPSIRHRRRYSAHTSRPAEHDDGEQPRPDDDGVDHPLRHGVEPAEEIRGEPDQSVSRTATRRRGCRAAARRRRRTAGRRPGTARSPA